MTRVCTALLFTVMSVSVQAEGLSTRFFLASAVADWSSTAYCTASPRCQETNPLLAPVAKAGSVPLVATLAASDLAGLWIWQRTVGRQHPKLAAVGLLAIGSLKLYVAAQNVREGQIARGGR